MTVPPQAAGTGRALQTRPVPLSKPRPFRLFSLLGVLATLALLTALLGSLVWNRIHLLQTGAEIVLKTAPVDPRDLLRGHFVRLGYEISNLRPADLNVEPGQLVGPGFAKNRTVYVLLEEGIDGFWSARSLQTQWGSTGKGQIVLRGRVRHNGCARKRAASRPIDQNCRISLRYGTEKFFTDKKGARKLEAFTRRMPPELERIDRRIASIAESLHDAEKRRAPNPGALKRQMEELHRQRRLLMQRHVERMSAAFAVILRVSQKTGEATISGLQLDGRPIYEEQLF